LKRLSFSAEFILDNDLTPVSTPDDDVDAESIIKPNSKEEVKIVPKFIDTSPPMKDTLLSTNSNSYTLSKNTDKQKKRVTHMLNKKLMKFIKRKPNEARSLPLKVVHDLSPNVTLVEAKSFEEDDETNVTECLGKDNESFTDSFNTFERSQLKRDGLKIPISQSQSTHSLEKVEEGKFYNALFFYLLIHLYIYKCISIFYNLFPINLFLIRITKGF